VGKRNAFETVAKILVALLEQRTITQAELARRAEVDPRTIRKHMLALQEAGVPVERDEDHPNVYWSVPAAWFPGGARLTDAQLHEVGRLIARHPKTQTRERILAALLSADPRTATVGNATTLQPPEDVLAILEDAAAARVAVHLRYFSATRGDHSDRHLTIHRIDYGPTARLVATCHRDGQLKWFRIDRVERPQLAPLEPARSVPAPEIDRFIADSFQGFRGPGSAEPYTFTIRRPEGRWAARSLPIDANTHTIDYRDNHIHVTVHTAGLDALARHLVGLGDLAHAETPTLRARIIELARGALRANERPAKVNESSARTNRAAG
jgi:predicted DNA-binding transcriptional regulator YafY